MAVQLSSAEMELISRVSKKAEWSKLQVERRSDRVFDLEITGVKNDGTGFVCWLPLGTIHALLNWTQYPWMTDYPGMCSDGDWSAVRDSSAARIWDMFKLVLDRERIEVG